MSLQPSRPVYANFPSEHLTIAAGVAIFHLATERVVLCYHTRDKYWFLPKGRKNANEDCGRAAEREGYEESGYRNRLLPLPMRHRQPDSDTGHEEFVAEPVWTQFLQLSERTQYILFWYTAETIPLDIEHLYQNNSLETNPAQHYRPPPPFSVGLTLRERVEKDRIAEGEVYEPVRHEGTGVDEEEALYRACLMPVEEAREKLKGSVMEDVVRRGWEGIQARRRIEEGRRAGRS